MKRYEGKLAGIIGTIIIHLLAAILFVSVKLNSLERDMAKDYILILEEPEPAPDIKPIELPDLNTSRLTDIDIKIRNIVRNLANKEDPVIDPEEYQDRVKEEMIRNGALNEKNFIDDLKNINMENKDPEVSVESKDSLTKVREEAKIINYQGPTRVYYNLVGRQHRNLPIPIYKCEGEGKITVVIEVNREGTVLGARVDPQESSTTDQCLIETALESALASTFNRSPGSPEKEKGTITFHFVAQK